VQIEARDFFKQPFTLAELGALLKSLDLKPRDVLSTKSPSFRDMGLDVDTLSDEEILELIVQEPRLMKRPLIVMDGKPLMYKSPEQLVRWTKAN
jgi:arsenate reductase-like glutaredoxin family protein